MRIVAEHLSYTYNAKSPFETAALKDVSLTIEEGEFFGIIGQTGSGKSTFVQHLNGLLRLPSSLKKYRPKKPKKGEIPPPAPVLMVGKFDLADKRTDFRALRRQVGMVFQYPEYQLFAETVRDDVAFGLKNFSDGEPGKEETDAAVDAALAAVGLDAAQIRDKSPFELSGGQKTNPPRGSIRSASARSWSFCTSCTGSGAGRSSSSRTTWTRSPRTARAPRCSRTVG